MPKKNYHFIDKAIKASKPHKVPVLENKIHTAIAEYLNMVIKRPSRWHTVEVSNQAGGTAMFRQIALKKRGCITGWPDIEIIWRDKCTSSCVNDLCTSGEIKMIFLEVKIPGGKLTDKQEALHKELKEDGHKVFVVNSVEDVKKILKYLDII